MKAVAKTCVANVAAEGTSVGKFVYLIHPRGSFKKEVTFR